MQFAGYISERIGYPSLLGELLIGVILGPPLIGILQLTEAVEMLSELGIFFLMLQAGMQIEIDNLKKGLKPPLFAHALE